MIRFNNQNFGKCEIICMLNEVAIIELEKNIEKYVVAIGLDFENRRWEQGIYCKDLKQASEIFDRIIEDFYMSIFKL